MLVKLSYEEWLNRSAFVKSLVIDCAKAPDKALILRERDAMTRAEYDYICRIAAEVLMEVQDAK